MRMESTALPRVAGKTDAGKKKLSSPGMVGAAALTFRSNDAVSPHSAKKQASFRSMGTSEASKDEAEPSTRPPPHISQALFDVFQITMEVEGVEYLAVRNGIQNSLQRGLNMDERQWVKEELQRIVLARKVKAMQTVKNPVSTNSPERSKSSSSNRRRSSSSKSVSKKSSQQDSTGEYFIRVDDAPESSHERRSDKKKKRKKKSSRRGSGNSSAQSGSEYYSYSGASGTELLPHSAISILGLGPNTPEDQEKKAVNAMSEISRLTAFYKAYFPAKVKDLPDAFSKFQGKERDMKNKVIQKYLNEAQQFFTKDEIRQALEEYELSEKILTQQMGMIPAVVNSDGESDSDADDATPSIGKFAFH